MIAKLKWSFATVAALLASLAVAAGCQSTPEGREPPDSASPLVVEARRLRSLVDSGDIPEARGMMADDPRRWFEERKGPGRPWRIAAGSGGPWAGWDEQFNSRKEEVGWRSADRKAILTVRETNDYFQLLDRSWVTTEIVYCFDIAGKIDGMIIRAAGDRPPGRTAEFEAWLKANHPAEYAEMLPGGEIDPSGDHPARFRRMLVAWREAAGLPAVE